MIHCKGIRLPKIKTNKFVILSGAATSLRRIRNYVAKAQADDVFEFDELCVFCANKKNK